MKVQEAHLVDVKLESFWTESSHCGETIAIKMRGNADMAAHDQLKRFLDDVHASAMASRIKQVGFDVQELYFMNSTCLSLLMRLINAVIESSSPPPYSLRFKSNPNLRWQARSLRALSSYALNVVFVE